MAVRRGDQIRKIREMLLRRRRELLSEIERVTKRPNDGDAASRSGDAVDRAHSDAWLEQSFALAEADQSELDSIDEALQMIEEGHYGRCRGCGRSIPLARLRALPTAAYCVKCRLVLDRSGHGSSRRSLRLCSLDTTNGADDDLRVGRRGRNNVLDDLLSDEPAFLRGN